MILIIYLRRWARELQTLGVHWSCNCNCLSCTLHKYLYASKSSSIQILLSLIRSRENQGSGMLSDSSKKTVYVELRIEIWVSFKASFSLWNSSQRRKKYGFPGSKFRTYFLPCTQVWAISQFSLESREWLTLTRMQSMCHLQQGENFWFFTLILSLAQSKI